MQLSAPGSMLLRSNRFRHILPGCHGNIVQDGGELICTTCGATRQSEESFEQSEQRKSSFQSIRAFHNSSLGTFNVIHTQALPNAALQPEYNKESRLIEMIDNIGRNLELPQNKRMMAADLGVKVLRRQTAKRVLLLPISIYAVLQVCRMADAQRSLAQVLAASQFLGKIDQEQLFKEFNRLTSRSDITYRISTPSDYINSIVKKLEEKLPDARIYLRAVYLRAQDILSSTRMKWQGKSPIRVATYCLYAADKELGYKIGIELLSSVSNTSTELLKAYENKLADPNQIEEEGTEEIEALIHKESRSFRSFLTISA